MVRILSHTPTMRIPFFLVFSIIFAVEARCQEFAVPVSDYRIVARIGMDAITADELGARFDATPWPGKQQKGRLEAVKRDFLQAMITERLLSLEGLARGIELEPGTARILEEIERLLVLDALYRIEILNPANPSESQVDSAFAAQQTYLTIVFAPFDNAGIPVSGSLAFQADPDTLLLSWAELRPEVRSRIPADAGISETVWQIELDGRSYLYQVLDESFARISDPAELDAARNRVRTALRQEREDILFEQCISRFSRGKTAEIDGEILALLARTIEDRFQVVRGYRREAGAELYPLVLSRLDLEAIADEMGRTAEKPLITSSTFSRSAAYVLDRLAMKEFTLRDARQSVTGTMARHVERLIQEEFLLQEGFGRRLHLSPDVERDIGIWRRAYVATAVARQYDVDQEDLQQMLKELASRHGVHVDEMVLGSIPASNFSTMVIRNLGFNNRMPAVPGLPLRFRIPLEAGVETP
jgi:hypothetical protein